MNANNYCVYLIIDPRSNLPFYVGKGRPRRPKQHIRRKPLKKSVNKEKQKIINELLDLKISPEIKIVGDNLCEQDAWSLEKSQVQLYGRRRFGGILTNMTDGGDGKSHHITSEETKKRISKSMRGTKNHFYGKKHSKESLEKIGTINRGKHLDPAWKEKLSLSQKGKPKSLEHRMKISKSLKERFKNMNTKL